MPKPKKEIIEEYKKAIEYGCVVCRKIYGVKSYNADTQIHHLRGVGTANTGMSLKSKLFIPLCVKHHVSSNEAFHVIGQFSWENKFGTQLELLEYYKKEVE